jgi:molybdenum cofactor cytidylyltransferase
MILTILIPAAGSSSRMRGGDKLLELVQGEPMLRRQARIARAVCQTVLVTLREADPARREALHGLKITTLPVPDAAEGMAASIRTGALQAKTTALLILPADMPEITQADLQRLIDAFDQAPDLIHRGCTATHSPGHPVIFPADLLAELQSLTGDEGARGVLQRHKQRINLIPLPDQHAATDLDTPEDWAAWRALRR